MWYFRTNYLVESSLSQKKEKFFTCIFRLENVSPNLFQMAVCL